MDRNSLRLTYASYLPSANGSGSNTKKRHYGCTIPPGLPHSVAAAASQRTRRSSDEDDDDDDNDEEEHDDGDDFDDDEDNDDDDDDEQPSEEEVDSSEYSRSAVLRDDQQPQVVVVAAAAGAADDDDNDEELSYENTSEDKLREEIQYAIETIENEEWTLYNASPISVENDVLHHIMQFTEIESKQQTIEDFNRLVDNLWGYVKHMTTRQFLAFRYLRCHVSALKTVDQQLIGRINNEINDLRQELDEHEFLDAMLQERLNEEEGQRQRVEQEFEKLGRMEYSHEDERADFDGRVRKAHLDIYLTKETETELLEKINQFQKKLSQVQKKRRHQESKMEKLLKERSETIIRHEEEENRQRHVLEDLESNGIRPR